MKPSNVFIITELNAVTPPVKILDFGSSTNSIEDIEADTTEVVTRIGTAVGTPQYMSPEQICGMRDFDGGVDVFGCGLILYEMVTGHRPFEAVTTQAIFDQVLRGTYTPATVRNRDLPADVDEILAKALAVDRRERYTTAAFAAALDTVRSSIPTPAGTPSPVTGPNAERLAYLHARFREVAVLHRRAQREPSSSEPSPSPPRPSTSTLEVPATPDADSTGRGRSTPAIPSLAGKGDPEGTATTRRHEPEATLPSIELPTEVRGVPPRGPSRKGRR
jgi:serine/threonine-protein kinase